MKVTKPKSRTVQNKGTMSATATVAEIAGNEIIEEVDGDEVENILSVEEDMKTVLVGRSKQVRGLTLALITGQHMMMEGEPGIAKTMLATEFADRVEGDDFVFFKTQLSKGMVTDQILGPTSLRKLRNEDTYSFNTDKMLPKAHLGILDEVYRGPEMLLPTIMSILNERKFHNGNLIEHCPLITCVGTTNFEVDSEELKAFHDRWLVNCHVHPLSSAEERITMLQRSLMPRKPRGATIGLSEIRALHTRREEVKVTRTMLQLYEAMIQGIKTKGKGKLRHMITDRRMGQALRLAQANAVLNKRAEVTPDDLVATEYGLIIPGLKEEEQIFGEAYTAEIGQYQQLQKEEEDLTLLRKLRDKYYTAYDEGLSKERLTNLQKHLRTVVNDYRGRQYGSSSNNSEFNRLYKEFESLLSSVAADLASS